MKLLYYASYILTAPFWALGWLLYGLSFAFDWIGGFIHDKTTYQIWLVLHRRNISRLERERNLLRNYVSASARIFHEPE